MGQILSGMLRSKLDDGNFSNEIINIPPNLSETSMRFASPFANYQVANMDPFSYGFGMGYDGEDNLNNENKVNVQGTNNIVNETEKNNDTVSGISVRGRQFIMGEEGFRAQVYRVNGEGNLTIGVGHEILPDESFPDGISREKADELLANDISRMKKTSLNPFLKRYNIQLNQHQYDALVSFTFNMGENIWDADMMGPEGEDIRELFISGNYRNPDEVVKVFIKYNNKGLLLKRRLNEAKLFNSGKYGDEE